MSKSINDALITDCGNCGKHYMVSQKRCPRCKHQRVVAGTVIEKKAVKPNPVKSGSFIQSTIKFKGDK